MFAALTLILLIISVSKPKLYFYLFLFAYVCFYEFFSYSHTPFFNFGIKLYLGDIFFIGFIFSIIYFRRHQKKNKKRSALDNAIIFYCAWIVICVLRGIPVWGASALGEARFVMWVFIYFPVMRIFNDLEKLNALLKYILYLVVGYSFYFLTYRFFVQFERDFSIMIQSRLFGADLSLILAAIFVFSFSIYLSNIKKNRLFLIAIMIFCVISIFTGARTGMVAWSISTSFLILVYLKKPHLFIKPAFIVLALSTISILFYLNPFSVESGINSRILASYGTSERTGFINLVGPNQNWEVDTASWRMIGWENLINQTIKEHPIFGDGFGAYYDLYESEMKGVPPHNDFLVIFSKMGFIGLILLLNILIQFYRSSFNFLKQSSYAIMKVYVRGLMAVFMAGLIGGLFFGFFPFIWIAVGLQGCIINSKNHFSKLT